MDPEAARCFVRIGSMFAVERDVAGDVGCAEGRINGSAE
jgi:hypothetical protein